LRNSFLHLLTHTILAILVAYTQSSMTICEYKCVVFDDWFTTSGASDNAGLAGLHALSFLMLFVLAIYKLINDLFTPTLPSGFAPDAQVSPMNRWKPPSPSTASDVLVCPSAAQL
jgi:hypothetical protein